MLFLAVFCGFLAEYQLEHKIEKDREKIYIQNMLEDLEADIIVYADYASRNAVIYNLVDTLEELIKNPDRKKHISKLTYAARILTAKWKKVAPVKRTYEQMKSIVDGYFSSFSKDEQEKFFGKNVINFYKL